MSFNHKLGDIATRSAGFESSKTILSQAIYTDLVLGKKWKEVDYKPVQSLDICIFLAKDPDRHEQLFILPIFQENTKLSIERIKDIFDLLSEDLAIEEEIEKLTLAIYAPDSTIVYYHIKKGLTRPIQRNLEKST
ncbi:hypothetical protein A0J61_11557 [Choanephora cucurbitarum]|uniref:tRNA-splicing endonuclease subunit Sen15 domain-containing protein n=1 Tax=Choanephora cucurbitarum TaxID=101091 RepID=A0A1C7MZ40_9FUNG|nr:hypothetical protein A0J61_11557 [Choanephora cucurbitarum]